MMKISKQRLAKIIKEELSTLIYEQVDADGIKTVVTNAAGLLKAIETFKSKSPTASMINALTPQLDAIEKVLEEMINNPSSYVDVVKKEPKTIKLRPVKNVS